MIEIAIAIVIVAGIAGFIANKYLVMKYALNTQSSSEDAIAAFDKRINAFDERINNTLNIITFLKFIWHKDSSLYLFLSIKDCFLSELFYITDICKIMIPIIFYYD